MLVERVATVRIYKGISRTESRTKSVFVGLDDLPEDISESEINDFVIADVNEQMTRTEDYAKYGKNWEIVDIHNA